MGRYSVQANDQESYSNLSANHIGIGRSFNIVGRNQESGHGDNSDIISGSVIIDVYVIKEEGPLKTAGDIYKGRPGDNLVKVSVQFDTEVNLAKGVQLRFKIFSVNNSSKPTVTMSWKEDPLKGKVEIPNCWVLFSHKVRMSCLSSYSPFQSQGKGCHVTVLFSHKVRVAMLQSLSVKR